MWDHSWHRNINGYYISTNSIGLSMDVDHGLVITNYTNDSTIANGRSCCHIRSRLVTVPSAEALCSEQTKSRVIICKCSSKLQLLNLISANIYSELAHQDVSHHVWHQRLRLPCILRPKWDAPNLIMWKCKLVFKLKTIISESRFWVGERLWTTRVVYIFYSEHIQRRVFAGNNS